MADIDTNIYDWSTTEASNKPTGATTIATGLDDNLRRIQATVRTEYNKHVVSQIPCGRLTLTSGTAVTTSDVTAAETLYYTPYKGNTIALYDGTNWRQYTFTERSIDVPDATQVQDVFIYDNAGTLTLELTTWTNDTTRATALTTQDGILVKTGALTRRYLGTFYSTIAGNGQTEDSAAKRYLWNYYHRARRLTRSAQETTDAWSYTTAAYRQANANTANQFEVVIGVSEDLVEAAVLTNFQNGTGNVSVAVGIGIDSSTVNSATLFSAPETGGTQITQISCFYRGYPGIGKHDLRWLEYSEATGTTSWYGDLAAGVAMAAGISGELLG